MIGTDTSNTFVDTLRMSNLYLSGMGADFDGDTTSSKGVYLEESNEELEEYVNSKANFINFSGGALRSPGADAIQSLYALSRVLDGTNLTKNIEFA